MNAFLNMQLPWSSSILDDKRYYNILTVLAGVMLLMSIIITITDVPELTRAEKEELPPQLARVILEKKELPPPKPVEPPKEEKKPDEKKPEEKKPEEKKPDPKPDVKPEPKPKPEIDRAKQQAEAEIAQFKDDLADMREMLPTANLQAANTTAIGQTQATQIDRAMLTSGAKVASGGISSANLSRDVGGVALSGRENTKVKSTLAENTKKANTATAGNSDGAGGAARDRSEISRVMDQHKGAIYQIYNKALRQNATLQGKMVVKIVIDPNGKIVDASIVSSELDDKELESAILRRIRMITFPSSNVIRTTVNQTFDFLPQ